MKKIIFLILALSLLLYGCTSSNSATNDVENTTTQNTALQQLGNEKFGTVNVPKSDWEVLIGEDEEDEYITYYDNTKKAIVEFGFGMEDNVDPEDENAILEAKDSYYSGTFASDDFSVEENVDFRGYESKHITCTFIEPMSGDEYVMKGYIFTDENNVAHFITVDSKPEHINEFMANIENSFELGSGK